MASTREKAQGERTAGQARSAGQQAFPWERVPGESREAYTRFTQYRLAPPGERSVRKLGISSTLASRWSARWSWVGRAAAYDDWIVEANDALGLRGSLSSRLASARFGMLAVAKASATVAKLNETKLTVDELITLAKTGVQLERQALGMTDGDTRAERAPLAQVAISLGSTPPWLTGPITNDKGTEPNAVVLAAEQVIAGESSASAQRPAVNVKRLAEKIVKSPKAGK